jgi:uncharacterized protein (DUF2141 family)
MQFTAILTSSAQCTIKPVVHHASCSGGSDGSIQLQVTGTPPYRFEWSNGLTTQDINNLTPGTYNVKIFDAKGHRSEETIEVSQFSSLKVVKKISTPAITNKDNGIIEVTVTGGNPPYLFFLSNYSKQQNIKRIKQSSNSFQGLPNGKYLIDVMDAKGCMATLSINLR